MHVLFVDDDEVVAQSVEMALRENGHDCQITDLGERALAMSKRHDYDIIVLDVGLPDIDGDQIARRMKMEGVKTPLLLQSGINDPALSTEAESLGVDGFLAKPFSIKELIERMEAILGLSGTGASDPSAQAPARARAAAKPKARQPGRRDTGTPETKGPWEPWETGGKSAAAPGPLPDAPPRPSAVAQARAALRARPEPPTRLQAASEAMAESGTKALSKARSALAAKPGSRTKPRPAPKAKAAPVAKVRAAGGAKPPSKATGKPVAGAGSGAKAGSSLAARARAALDANPLSKAVAKARTTFSAKSVSRGAAGPKPRPAPEITAAPRTEPETWDEPSGPTTGAELPAKPPVELENRVWGEAETADPIQPKPASADQSSPATAQQAGQEDSLELTPHFLGTPVPEPVAAEDTEEEAGEPPAAAETADKSGADRRRHKRLEIVEAAVIMDGDTEIPCVIIDLSESGAALMLCDAAQPCADRFVLAPLDGPEHSCVLRWREGENIGVEFL